MTLRHFTKGRVMNPFTPKTDRLLDSKLDFLPFLSSRLSCPMPIALPFCSLIYSCGECRLLMKYYLFAHVVHAFSAVRNDP